MKNLLFHTSCGGVSEGRGGFMHGYGNQHETKWSNTKRFIPFTIIFINFASKKYYVN
jgi:hypothetical protein